MTTHTMIKVPHTHLYYTRVHRRCSRSLPYRCRPPCCRRCGIGIDVAAVVYLEKTSEVILKGSFISEVTDVRLVHCAFSANITL